MKLYTLMSPKVIASITFDLAVQIHTTEVQLFMYQNQSERYLKVFCINRTANVCYDFNIAHCIANSICLVARKLESHCTYQMD